MARIAPLPLHKSTSMCNLICVDDGITEFHKFPDKDQPNANAIMAASSKALKVNQVASR